MVSSYFIDISQRRYLENLCHTHSLSVVYLWQAISIYIRIVNRRRTSINPSMTLCKLTRDLLSICLDLAVRYLGPQNMVDVLRGLPGQDVRAVHIHLFGNKGPKKGIKCHLELRMFIDMLKMKI